MAEGRDGLLRDEDLAADGAVAALGLAVRGAGGGHRRVGHGLMLAAAALLHRVAGLVSLFRDGIGGGEGLACEFVGREMVLEPVFADQEVFVGMEFGQSREYSEEVAAKIDREVAQMLKNCYETAKEIIRDKKERLDQLAEALLKQETLNRAEFIALMESGEIPEGLGEDKPRTTEEVLKQAAEENAENTPEYKTEKEENSDPE